MHSLMSLKATCSEPSYSCKCQGMMKWTTAIRKYAAHTSRTSSSTSSSPWSNFRDGLTQRETEGGKDGGGERVGLAEGRREGEVSPWDASGTFCVFATAAALLRQHRWLAPLPPVLPASSTSSVSLCVCVCVMPLCLHPSAIVCLPLIIYYLFIISIFATLG